MGLMKNTAEENIMEHSWQVAVVAHGLATIKNDVFGGNVDAEHIAMLAYIMKPVKLSPAILQRR